VKNVQLYTLKSVAEVKDTAFERNLETETVLDCLYSKRVKTQPIVYVLLIIVFMR